MQVWWFAGFMLHGLRSGSAVVHRFDQRDPQIQQSEPGDHAAYRAIHEKRAYPREVVEKLVVCPQWRIPGKHQHDNADIDADDDIKVQLHAAKPEWDPSGSLGSGLPILHGRAA